MAQTENSVTAYDVEDWKNKGRMQMSPAERESWLNEGQLLLTDYAEGIEREWELIKFYGQLLAAVADWCIVFLKGAHGPKWTDGQELNYKRRRIEYQQEEMIAHGFFIPPEFADLPPEMDVNYMRGRENIKKNAKAALKQILENPDYQFVADHASFLRRIQTACMRIRPDEVTGRVGKLQEAVEKNDFLGMRRYADADPVIAAAAVCTFQFFSLFGIAHRGDNMPAIGGKQLGHLFSYNRCLMIHSRQKRLRSAGVNRTFA